MLHVRSNSAWHCLTLLAALLMASGCSLFKNDDTPDAVDGGIGDMCVNHSECASAFRCAGGRCQLAGSAQIGGPCSANIDCATGLFCTQQGVCGPAGAGDVGAPCATGAECLPTLTCQVFGFGGSCVAAGTGDIGAACTDVLECMPGLACANDGTCKGFSDAFPPFTGVECPDDESTFKAYFQVPRAGNPPADFFQLPFPNDARVDATGALDMSDFPRPGPSILGIDLVSLYVDALVADFNGFGSTGPVIFRFSKQFNFDSLGNGSEVHFVDLTPGFEGQDRGRSFGYTTARGLYVCQHSLVVRNEVHNPLLPGHTYAVYLTTNIRSVDSEAPEVDADFAAMLSDTRPTGDAELENAWDKYQPLRDWIAMDGSISTSDVAVAAVFTVQDTTGVMERLSTAINSEALPAVKDLTLCDGATASPCDDGGSRVCGSPNADFHEIHGRVTIPQYQGGTPPYEVTGGEIVEVGGVPQKQFDEDVCFVMTVPKTTMPGTGWPLVVFTHGTGGSFTSPVNSGISRALATSSQPAVVFSFDGVVHGSRARGSTRDTDGLMFNVINPRAARDNVVQSGADIVHLARLAQAFTTAAPLSAPGAGNVAFDATKVAYYGHSQGGNAGALGVPVSNDIQATVLSGSGAFLTSGILGKTSPVSSKQALEFIIGEPIGGSHPLMLIWQTYFERSDPANYSPLFLRRPPSGVSPKHVFHGYGLGDTFSPESTMNHMGLGLGIPTAQPVLRTTGQATLARPISQNMNVTGGPRTAATFQYDPAGAYDGHFVLTRDNNAVADWVAFLTSIWAGSPSVP